MWQGAAELPYGKHRLRCVPGDEDTLGLALHNELTLGESDHVMVSINGEGAGELAVDGDNLVVRGAQSLPVDDAAGRRGRRLLL